jgi:hypothetical protein
MVSDKVKEEWISAMCRDHPRLPRFMIEDLADTYCVDDGEWCKENKKKEEKKARKQAKKGKGKLIEAAAEQDPNKFKIVGAIEVEHITEEQRAAEEDKEKQMLTSIVNVIDNLRNPNQGNLELLDYARENPGCSVELEGGGFVVVHPDESDAED